LEKKELPELLTIKEAMEILRIKSRTTFYRLVKEGKIKPVRISARKVLIKREDIERLLNQNLSSN
jgi:excisionase family DNA binding protein